MTRALKSEDVCAENEVGLELDGVDVGEDKAEETSLATKAEPKVLP